MKRKSWVAIATFSLLTAIVLQSWGLLILAIAHILKIGRGTVHSESLRCCAYWFGAAIVVKESPVPPLLLAAALYAFDRAALQTGPSPEGVVIIDFSYDKKKPSKRVQQIVTTVLGMGFALILGRGSFPAVVSGVLAIEMTPVITHRLPFLIVTVLGLFLSSSCALYRAVISENVSRALHASLFHLSFCLLIDKPIAVTSIPFLYMLV